MSQTFLNRTRCLDTCVLIKHWQRRRAGKEIGRVTAVEARSWADDLIRLQRTDVILTPIAVEFLCGVMSEHAKILSEAFLEGFTVLDEGKITPEDWASARRRAQWVRDDRKARDLGDCLITAIADRFRLVVITFDQDADRRARRPDTRRRS